MEIKIVETTLRKMCSDYIYRRIEFKKEMRWKSEFSPDEIVVLLEERPNSQESLGFHLVKEKEV